MDPAVEGALISGVVAVALQLINWGREASSDTRGAAQAQASINEQRLDELRGVLEEAARRLRAAHELLRGATGEGPRDTADARHIDFRQALAIAGDMSSRLGVRVGQSDPLAEAYNQGLGALDAILPLVESMKGPHRGYALSPEQKQRILTANATAAAAAIEFEQAAAAVVGPQLTVRPTRGSKSDDPKATHTGDASPTQSPG